MCVVKAFKHTRPLRAARKRGMGKGKGGAPFQRNALVRSLMLIKPPLSPAKLFEKKNAECCSTARAGFSTIHPATQHFSITPTPRSTRPHPIPSHRSSAELTDLHQTPHDADDIAHTPRGPAADIGPHQLLLIFRLSPVFCCLS